MARKRSRIEGLKMPFVVTVALGAAAACGGTVTGSDGEGRRTGDTGGGAGGAGQGDEPFLPDHGGAPPIGFGGMYELGGAPFATGGTSNPPPPPNRVCPPERPGPGDYCNYQGLPCNYQGCSHVTATCEDYSWRVITSTCNPPAPSSTVCPTEPPTVGTYCNYQGEPCGYHSFPGNDCGYLDTVALCDGYQWEVTTCNVFDGGVPSIDSGAPTPDGG